LNGGSSYAIIPVREFENSKLRLAANLTEPERSALTKALLVHVLREVQNSLLSGGLVVSSDPEQVSELIGKFQKIQVIAESSRHGGVNSAIYDGISVLKQIEGDPRILLMPSDLPFLSSKAINKVIELLRLNELVINPSIKKDGTNLLAFIRSKCIRLYYDSDSYSNHVREAKSDNLKIKIIEWKEFSHDLDDISDLQTIKRQLKADSLQSLIQAL